MRKSLLSLVLVTLLLGLVAAPAAAQTSDPDESVLVRINGDVSVPAGDAQGVVVVVDGNLDLEGTATTVVVVNGTANLTGATLTTLVVISGEAILGPETTVTGDVRLIDSPLTQDTTAVVEGDISKGARTEFLDGFWIIGLLFMIGWAILVLLAGLLLAAVAPDLGRKAGRSITTDLGQTIIAGLVLWVGVPIVAIGLFATIVGIPTALTIWLVALPVMGFVGFLATGIRIGEYITERNGDGVGHPYLASVVGLLVLIVVGAIPFIGPIIVPIAGFLGSGALALHAWRAMRSAPSPPAPAIAPESVE